MDTVSKDKSCIAKEVGTEKEDDFVTQPLPESSKGKDSHGVKRAKLTS